ncbi:MFS transporter [Deinococcus caeni]|uniref:MFS transporter n=1 Tax=Deinococcus caeni TaxID=569127 RepID=UPI00360EABB1
MPWRPACRACPFWRWSARPSRPGGAPVLRNAQPVRGLLAFAAGLLVRWILASDLPFPLNYALIFALGTAAFTFGYWVFGLVKEPPDPPLLALGLRGELRAIPETLRDPHFRAFLTVRLLLAGASMSEPFFAVNALRELHYPAATLGIFVMALTGAAPLSNIVWQRVAERKGSRRIIRYASVCYGLAPLYAVAVGALGLNAWAYLGVFVLSSVATQGFNLGHTNHLLNIAPEHARSRYIGTLNTLVGAALFTPVLGACWPTGWGTRRCSRSVARCAPPRGGSAENCAGTPEPDRSAARGAW